MQWEIRFSGTGGQGLILAAIILAEAEGVREGLHVVQTQSYGPEARGGASKADVIISDTEILHSEVLDPDYLVCLSQQAYERYQGAVTRGVIVYDPLFVTPIARGDIRQIALPATEMATAAGSRRSANIAALGGLTALMGLKRESVLEAVKLRVPKPTIEVNQKVFVEGAKAMDVFMGGVNA